MNVCSDVNCVRPASARGMCNTHYMQQRRAGLIPTGTRLPAPVAERFWRYVKKTDTCWLWTGSEKKLSGYGQIGLGGRGGKKALAHRLSYEMHKGPIPDGLVVMHSCDTPRCVNPSHLSVGTHSENTMDSVRKGRWKAIPPMHCGEDQHNSKLTTEDVIFIRDRLDIPSKELAERF